MLVLIFFEYQGTMKRCAVDTPDDTQGEDAMAQSLDKLSIIPPHELLGNTTALRLLLKTLPPRIEKVTSGDVVANLIDLLEAEIVEQRARNPASNPGGFWNNRGQLIDAYCQGRLFTQSLPETDASFNHREFSVMLHSSGVELKDGFHTLPCFCVVNSDGNPTSVDMIWVWKPLRRLGLGRAFIKEWNIREVRGYLADSEAFWKHCDVQLVHTS